MGLQRDHRAALSQVAQPAPSLLYVALACRCPRCGRGRLFRNLLEVRDHCEVCDLDLRGNDAGDGPAVFVILGLGAIVMMLVFWVEFRFEPPWWVHVLIWGPLTVGLAVFATTDQGIDWSIVTAATLMTSAPLLVAFLLFQRQFVQSFMRAGIR